MRRSTFLALAATISFSIPALAASPGETADDAGTSAAVRAKAGKSKRHKHHPLVSGYQVPDGKLRSEPPPKPSGHLHLYAVNFKEELEVDLYDQDGQLNPESLQKLYHLWRCKRTGTEKPIDNHLFEILSMIQDHFDGKTIELVSGFRNQQHTTSFHFHGSASDIHIPGVSDKALRDYADSLDTGGMGVGIYPKAGFVHVDVRPEQSYRWTDYSPGGTGEGYSRRVTHHKKTPNS